MRNRALVLVAALAGYVSAAPPASAQVAQDAELRRAVANFQSGDPATALNAINRIPASRLTRSDQAIAQLYGGFSLMRLRRNVDGESALARAVVLDPSQRPDPQHVSQDLLDAYRVARSRVPVIATFDVVPRDFVPQLDSVTKLEYSLEGNRLLRRTRAEMRFSIIKAGTADSAVLWRGTEGDPFSWDGRFLGQIIPEGEYEYVLEARAPTLSISNIARRFVTIRHGSPDMSRALPMPTMPRVLPESTVFSVENTDRKGRLVRRGTTMMLIGGILAAASLASSSAVVDRTAPRSAGRYAVAGSYALGLGSITLGALTAIRGKTADYRNDLTFPNNENIRINRESRAQYQADLERANKYNETLAKAVAVKQIFHEERR